MSRQTFGRRVNQWLAEPKGEIFRDGKWRFWFPMVIGFSIINAVLTAMVFGQGGGLAANIGAIVISVGALLAWIGVGAFHYSDSTDSRMSRDVAALDSLALICMAAHFCFLLWVYGHTQTLARAETDYKIAFEKYNADARQVQTDNARIADSLRDIATAEKEKTRLEADAAYWERKGGKRRAANRAGITANISMAPVELAKPPSPPADSSAGYLARWDSLIRLANFGELALAIITLIYIRVRSSMTNKPHEEDFPDEIDTSVTESLTLSELLMITADWEKTNERRTELIFKKVKKSISPEESAELNELQQLTDARIRLIAPLPIMEMEAA